MSHFPAVTPTVPNSPAGPSFREACRFWLWLGFVSFGGPTGQIAIMHEEVVRRRRWISEDRFLHALNFCLLLPGPEAQQLAIYLGWLLHRTRGGLVAGILFVLPSAILLWLLSWLYVTHGDVSWIRAAFDGLQAAVLALVLTAVVRIGRTVLKTVPAWVVAVTACFLMVLRIPFPWILLGAALIGGLGGHWAPALFCVPAAPGSKFDGPDPGIRWDASAPPTLACTMLLGALGLALWWLPVVLLGALLGGNHILVHEGLFFGKAAMLTFGGAYAVLPYVAQQAVETHGWLNSTQMLDGLGLAETTPGPLIMVLQFVGFLGAWHHPEPFPPLWAATFGAAITTWTTFVPCFLWILLGAPYVERLRHQARLSPVLSALSSAVVGTMLFFLITLTRGFLFPRAQPVNVFGLILALLACLALNRARWSVPWVVLLAAAAGIARHVLSGGAGPGL